MRFDPDKYALKNWRPTLCIGLILGVLILVVHVLFGPERQVNVLGGVECVVGWTAAAFWVNALCYGKRT